MPAGSIHIKPDGMPLQSLVEMTEDFEETLPISSFCLNHPIPSQQGSHPARNVQALVMLTGGGDAKTPSLHSPPPTQSGMEAKACLVLEDHRLLRSQRLKFFLKSSEISGHLRLSLVSKSNWPASGGIPDDASSSGPVLLLRLSQSVALNGSPPWGHPTGLDSAQTLEVTSPSGLGALSGSLVPIGWVCQASAWALRPLILLRSLHESTGLDSCASSPRPRLSIPGADPPRPGVKRQSLSRSRLRGFPRLQLKDALSWPQDGSKSMWGFAYTQVNIPSLICHFI